MAPTPTPSQFAQLGLSTCFLAAHLLLLRSPCKENGKRKVQICSAATNIVTTIHFISQALRAGATAFIITATQIIIFSGIGMGSVVLALLEGLSHQILKST
mmetsp:Transcript_6132/g.9546  ORF Transcript_6132/g.9546 Transcript_6132/m.9546 type:complete len:101 (-) Transcript_6132:1384-1686(-)